MGEEEGGCFFCGVIGKEKIFIKIKVGCTNFGYKIGGGQSLLK